jgi:hypothetical protein
MGWSNRLGYTTHGWWRSRLAFGSGSHVKPRGQRGAKDMTLTIVEKDVLDKAVSLHGHLGPFLVLGLKMGLKARSIIGMPNYCEVFTIMRKPYVCAVDGLRTVVGGNIILHEDDGLSARFSNGMKSVIISVRKNLVEKHVKTPWDKCEESARLILGTADEELFESCDIKALE